MVLTTRKYFGTIGTFATKTLDKNDRLVDYGNHGSGRSIFGMCQMVTSDHCYTESSKGGTIKKYYWQYWLVAMETNCKIENLFHANVLLLAALAILSIRNIKAHQHGY